MSHTPGPWTTDEAFVWHLPAGESNDVLVADCGETWDSHLSDEAKQANARLIAAAPDLLEALRECLACLESPSKLQGDAIRQARAAIAKAEGK